jgi:hypothetical protein
MNTQTGLDRRAAAWLADGPTELSDRVLDAALHEVHLTQQRRAMRVPWRFPLMPALTRATGIAAVALVAVVGAGGLIYLNAPGGPGGSTTPPATKAPSPTPSFVAPGIISFTPYTSAAYGITFGYPDGWTVTGEATRKWQPGDPRETGWFDEFAGDDIVFLVYQQPAGPGADITSREGLAAWFEANLCDEGGDPCGTVADVAVPMCAGTTACLPAILVPKPVGGVLALFADAEKGTVTIVLLGRSDSHPTAARYGGGIQLLKSILMTFGVREPQPNETPH